MSKALTFTGAYLLVLAAAGYSVFKFHLSESTRADREKNKIIAMLREGRWGEVPTISGVGTFDYVVSIYKQGAPKLLYKVTVTQVSTTRRSGQDLFCLGEVQSAVKGAMNYFSHDDAFPNGEVPFPVTGTSCKFVSNGRMKLVFERRRDGKLGLHSIWVGYRG